MTDDPRVNRDELSARVGELRRLTIMFCDVVGSTELAARLEPETYRELMRGYHAACREVIESRFEGHVVKLQGDGALSTFGFPVAHENDAERAVRAGLALVRAVRELSSAAPSSVGEPLEVRVAVHYGPVYLDLGEDDIYGFAANVGARLHSVTDPGTVVVSDEVRRLVEEHFEIEAGDPQLVKGVVEPLQPFRIVGERHVPVRRSWSSPLLERDDELERLRQAWAGVAAGSADRASGILIHGDAGVGKSRLVTALAEEAAATSVVGLSGSSFHLEVGFHPVRSLIEARCGIRDDADGAERLRRLDGEITGLGLGRSEAVPLLAPVLGIDASAGYEPAATEGRKLEEQVAHAVLGYVVACTQGQPAIVVAENLHWFDAATRGMLAELLRAGPGNVLVLATSRNVDDGEWETIELRPLTPAGRLALIDALESGLSERDRAALATRSAGIPLYLEELVRAGAAARSASLGDTGPVPGSVPDVLYEPLVARLYATPAALPVAATAAAAGQEVDSSLLAATMSLAGDELRSPLEALVDAGVLEPVVGRSGRYRFRHELLREVAYELQPPSWRRRVHDRLCDVLARTDATDWHVLASHFERAERNSEAAEAYRQAAEGARRRGALVEARAHLTRAIDLVAALGDETERRQREVELRLRRGFVAMSAGGAAAVEASADFDRCLQLAAADPPGDAMFSALIALWAFYLSAADLRRAREVSVKLRVGAASDRDYFRPQNLAGFGMIDWFEGSFARAVETLTTATDELAREGRGDEVAAGWFVPNDPTASMYAHLALARFMAGDAAGADESLARARDVAASLDFPQGAWSAAYATWLGSWIWIESGRLDEAGEALAELRSSSARHGFDSWAMIAATQTAALEAVRALRSDSADAAALASHGEALGNHVQIWRALGLRVFLPFYITTAGALLGAAGDVDGARGRYEESLALAAETGMRFYDAETKRRLAHLHRDRETVGATLRSAHDLARSQAARPFELRIARDLDALLGDDAQALPERASR